MEITLSPETEIELEKCALGIGKTPKEALEYMITVSFIPSSVKPMPGAGVHIAGSDSPFTGDSIVGDCMHAPSGLNDPISKALEVACSVFGVIKSATYNKSETAITLEIQFEKDLTHSDRKKGISERLKSFRAEWLLEPLTEAPPAEKAKGNDTTAGAP